MERAGAHEGSSRGKSRNPRVPYLGFMSPATNSLFMPPRYAEGQALVTAGLGPSRANRSFDPDQVTIWGFDPLFFTKALLPGALCRQKVSRDAVPVAPLQGCLPCLPTNLETFPLRGRQHSCAKPSHWGAGRRLSWFSPESECPTRSNGPRMTRNIYTLNTEDSRV